MRLRSPAWPRRSTPHCWLLASAGLLLAAGLPTRAEAFTPPHPPPRVARPGRCSMPSTVCMAAGAKRALVVGAGAAGLAAAKELRAQGHDVSVLEMSPEIGGVWRYDEETEDDPMGLQAARREVHSSMYKSLRTNLPREVMSYSDFPFDEGFSELRYPSHTVVQDYLLAYARHHDLYPIISLGRRVVSVEPDGQDERGAWTVKHCAEGGGGAECVEEKFDAIAVCNGHYSQPYVPEIPGLEHFPGAKSHSHNYRSPEQFENKRVVIVGASSSGEDIAQEVSQVAKSVVMCARSYLRSEWGEPGSAPMGPKKNLYRWRTIARVNKDGGLVLQDGSVVDDADCILFCTGYRYAFPFLGEGGAGGGVVSVDDNMIVSLYKHIFPPAHPTMAFIGIPAKIVPFPQFELQSRYMSKVWSGEISLPSKEDMLAEIANEAKQKGAAGWPQKYFHVLGGMQFDYNDELSRLCGSEPLPTWRRAMYEESGRRKRDQPYDYRDAPLPTIEEYQKMLQQRPAGSASRY